MHNVFSHRLATLTKTSLALALGLMVTACKDSPSHTNTNATPDNSIVTPPTSGPNGEPSVDAGSRQIADTGVVVLLSGTARFAEGASLARVEWQQLTGPTVSLLNTDSLNTQFISPLVENTVQMMFKLTVTDNQGRSSQDTVRITISPLASTLLLNGGTTEEAAGTFNFTLTMPTPLTAPLVVRYNTRDGSAVGGEDFADVTGELTLATGTISASIPVELVNDDTQEGNETLTLNVITDINGQTVEANATLTILDDDNTTPPTDLNPGDVLRAILERQSFIGNLSDPNTVFGKEALLDHPILDRQRPSPARYCLEGGEYTVAVETGEGRVDFNSGDIPPLERPVIETANACVDDQITTNGEATYTLILADNNFYQPLPENTNFGYNFTIDKQEIGTTSGSIEFSNYSFADVSGERRLRYDRYTKIENERESIIFDSADISMWLRGLSNASVQLANSVFNTHIVDGLMANQSLQISLIEDSDYVFGEGGILDNQRIVENAPYILPMTGHVRYRLSHGETRATIVARYFDSGFSVRMDLNGNDCMDARTDWLYFGNDDTSTGALFLTVPETPCQPLVESGSETSSETFEPIDPDQAGTLEESQI